MSQQCGVLFAASGERAVIKGNLTLRSQKNCDGDGRWDLKQGEKFDPIITCRRGECVVGARFLNRVRSRRSELHINPVKFGDEGKYIHGCNKVNGIWSVYVHLEPHRSTAVITAGNNLTIDLCSLDQVKLNFTQSGSSVPETLFIIDNGQAFGTTKAIGGIAVHAQNDTAVLSNMVQDGTVSVIDSKTDKMLCEVTFRVTGSGNEGEQVKASPDRWCELLLYGLIIICLFVIVYILYDKHKVIMWLLRKRCEGKPPISLEDNKEEGMAKVILHDEGSLEKPENGIEEVV
ncbi:uncharacterized protein LOC134467593 [Engraulis encrasicolus]|uniref:uncharacterized protein LOC134467593 n=1 Tax=Engraulis encrasicolus TaxID=184585 RepID=UPI002FD216AB